MSEVRPTVTAAQVHAEAIARHGEDGVTAATLGEVYEQMLDMGTRQKGGVFYTPKPVAEFMTTFALRQGLAQVGPDEPEQVLRIIACDPACGAGVFLVEAANLLAANYAGRLVGGRPSPELVFAVMPTVILWCCYGIDVDPVAVDLAKLALSLETGGTLPPAALDRHVVCGDALDGVSPPAMEERLGPPAVTA